MHNLLRLVFFSCFSFLAFPLFVNAQLLIEITEGVTNPTPIAIVPFFNKDTRALPGNISDVVTNDLIISSQFDLLNKKKMPDLKLVESGYMGYADWDELGVEYVIMGSVVPIVNKDMVNKDIVNKGSVNNKSSVSKDGLNKDTAKVTTGSNDPKNTKYKVRFELFDVVNRSSLVHKQIIFTPERYRDTAHRISDLIYEKMTGIQGIFSTKLAYVTVTGDRPEKRLYRLEIADADGARPKVVLKSFEPIMSPAWSPDSKKIAYVSFERGRSNIYIQDLETGERELFSGFKGINGAPAWSPDGKYFTIVLSRKANPDIHLVDLTTKKVQRLTRHQAIDTEPSWSSDGKRILFTSDREGGVHIYEMNLSNKKIKRITHEGKYNARGRYTLKDTSLVMVSQHESGAFNIVSQNFTTGSRKVLSTSFLDESPSVSANGSHIIFSTKRRDKAILVVVSVDLGIKYYLPYNRGEVRDPAWSPFIH